MLTEIEDMEVSFERRYRSRDQHLLTVQGTLVGCLKLTERARAGDPAESNDNISCAAMWLESAAAELRALLPLKNSSR